MHDDVQIRKDPTMLLGFENLFNKTKLDRIWETTQVFPWNVPQVTFVCARVLDNLKKKTMSHHIMFGSFDQDCLEEKSVDWLKLYFSEASGDCTGTGLLWDMMFECVFNTFHHTSKAIRLCLIPVKS